MPNILDPDIDEKRHDHEGFHALRARIGRHPDVVIYPDSGKVSPAERRPDGGGLRLLFRIADAVDYYDGEIPPLA